MRQILSLTFALTLLSACSGYDPDLDKAAKERGLSREDIRNSVGCQFADDHATYRKCIIATYESSKPKTFLSETRSDGKAVAIVSEGEVKPTDPSMFTPQETNTCITGNVLPGSVAPCTFQTQELYEVQLPPCPTCPPAPVPEEEKVVTISTTETVTEKPVEVVPTPEPMPEKTWWETYKEEQPTPKPSVVCPCPDPNDPCPQCVTK